jgi:hypothetical protein
MGQRAQPRASDPWPGVHHRLLRLGVLRSTPNGATGAVQQGEADYNRDPPHHIPEWRQLLRHASLLADADL